MLRNDTKHAAWTDDLNDVNPSYIDLETHPENPGFSCASDSG